MTTDAIQEDVSPEEVEAPQEQPVLSERELAMQAIYQQLADRNGEPLPAALPVVPEPEEPAAPEVPKEPAPAATPEKVRVKVDGEEKELPLADVIKGFQKDSVASKRLEQAAQLQRELDQRQARLDALERQIQAASVATPSPVDEDDGDEDLGAALDALVDGDNDTAKKLLAKALKKGRAPATPAVTIDPAEIAAQAEAAIEAKLTAKENARAFQEFVAANPVFADPEPDEEGNVLLSPQRVRGDYLFDTLYGPKWQRGEISYREALNKTAEHVNREFAPVTPQTPATPTPSEREQRKAKIDNIPVAHGAKQVAAPKERTAADAISEMAKWRGQG